MENKIEELTDKIYREGVERGTQEAQKLVADAEAQASQIVAAAKAEAEQIVAAARKQADELAENTRSELKLYAGQAVNALKSEVTNLVTGSIVDAGVKDFATDKTYLKDFIVALAGRWSQDEPIVISTTEADELKKYFGGKAKKLLDKGVTIKEVNGIKTLFTIEPADGRYKVEFGEEEFAAYFKEFLRPGLIELLFNS